MFKIYSGATEFKQWEMDQMVTNPCMKVGDEVVFRNASGKTYVTKAFEQDGVVLADVPNFVLQDALNVLIDLEQGADSHADCRTTFTVIAQAKPDDYDCQCNIPDRPVKTGGGSGDCDWNTMKNRPFGETVSWSNIETFEFEGASASENIMIDYGTDIKVVFDGEEYFFDSWDDGTYGGEGYPFEISAEFGGGAVGFILEITCGDGSHTMEFFAKEATTKTIDKKYLPELPFGTEIGETILAETVVSSDGVITDVVPVAVGNTYVVGWNGTEYTCVAAGFDIEGDGTIIASVLGDIGLVMGGTSTGEPFMIVVLPAEVAASEGCGVAVTALDGSDSATVSIKEAIVHPLPAMYLPELVVNFTAVDGVITADKTLEQIYEAFTKGYRVHGKTSTVSVNGEDQTVETIILDFRSIAVKNGMVESAVFTYFYSGVFMEQTYTASGITIKSYTG